MKKTNELVNIQFSGEEMVIKKTGKPVKKGCHSSIGSTNLYRL